MKLIKYLKSPRNSDDHNNTKYIVDSRVESWLKNTSLRFDLRALLSHSLVSFANSLVYYCNYDIYDALDEAIIEINLALLDFGRDFKIEHFEIGTFFTLEDKRKIDKTIDSKDEPEVDFEVNSNEALAVEAEDDDFEGNSKDDANVKTVVDLEYQFTTITHDELFWTSNPYSPPENLMIEAEALDNLSTDAPKSTSKPVFTQPALFDFFAL